MKKFAALALFALASNSVLAGEVGAPYPQAVSIAPTNVAIAVAETGASSSWATQSFEDFATGNQIDELNKHVESLNVKMQKELEASIAEKLEEIVNR